MVKKENERMVSDTAKDAEKVRPRVLGKPGAATSVVARRGRSSALRLSCTARAQVEKNKIII